MVPQWREKQWTHSLEAAEALRVARRGGGGFADREMTVLFYAAMSSRRLA